MKRLSQLSTKHHLIIFLALFIMIGTRNMAYATSTIESRQVEDNKYANLDVHVLPKEAIVKIGNEEYKTDNGVLPLNIPAGTHLVKVSAEGYKTHEQSITISRDLTLYQIGDMRYSINRPLYISLVPQKNE